MQRYNTFPSFLLLFVSLDVVYRESYTKSTSKLNFIQYEHIWQPFVSGTKKVRGSERKRCKCKE